MSETGMTRVRVTTDENGEQVLIDEADGSVVSTRMSQTDWARLDAMTDDEVEAAALADPDAQPMSPEQLAQGEPDQSVIRLRVDLGMTREQFSDRFQIDLATLREWEQGRRPVDEPARTLLRVIAYAPDVVDEALAVTQGDLVGTRSPVSRAP